MGELGLERGLENQRGGMCRYNKVCPFHREPTEHQPCALKHRETSSREPRGTDQLPAQRGNRVFMALTATGAKLPSAGGRHSIQNGHFESTWTFKATEQRAA